MGSIDSPTATGDESQTDPGFKPQFVMVGLTSLESADAVVTTGDEVIGWGFGAFTPDDEFVNSWASEDNVGTSNSQSLSEDVSVNLFDGPGNNLHKATFVEMLSTGWKWNFSAADGTARKWYYVAIEAERKAGRLSLLGVGHGA